MRSNAEHPIAELLDAVAANSGRMVDPAELRRVAADVVRNGADMTEAALARHLETAAQRIVRHVRDGNSGAARGYALEVRNDLMLALGDHDPEGPPEPMSISEIVDSIPRGI